MKKFILVLILPILSWAQFNFVPISADYASFASSDTSSFVQVYVSIYQGNLRYKMNEDSVYTAAFSTELTVTQNDSIIHNNSHIEADIEIQVRTKGKRLQTLSLLSGGEKTLTAISLLFAIYLVKPSPFCILDEVDAPLDDVNIGRFTKALIDFSANTQFIVVTHNKRTMEAASTMYGVTMEEEGVSKIVSVKFS